MIKEYVNQAGYKIKASEKAYNLLYKKNGFVPVEAGTKGTNDGEGEQVGMSPESEKMINEAPAVNVSGESPAEKTKKAPAGRKASGGKSKKAAADQDATEQPETDREQAGDEQPAPEAGGTEDNSSQNITASAAETLEDK